MSEPVDRMFDSVVGVGSQLAHASGWVALANGLIVTNHHVVGYLPRVALHTRAQRQVMGRIVHVDPRLDVAFVMPEEALDLPALPLGDSRAVGVGDPVSAVGHPFGLDYSVTRGIISSTRRRNRGREFLQTDAVLNPGNSGGPLLDREHRVIGVSTRHAHQDSIALDLAIPVHCFQDALQRFAGPPADVLKMQPRYACSECDASIVPDERRCARCGARIPYVDEPVWAPPQWIRAQHAVETLLQTMGVRPNTINVGPGAWHLEHADEEFLLTIVQEGEAIEVRTRIAVVSTSDPPMFLRFALTANDSVTGDGRLSIREDTLEFSRQELVPMLDIEGAMARLKEFAGTARKLRKVLFSAYGAAKPLSYSQDRIK